MHATSAPLPAPLSWTAGEPDVRPVVGKDDDVLRAVAGDAAAFERLYRRHARRVWSLARRLLGTSRADDMTQEVFLQAWRKLQQYRGTGAFGAWLLALARNLMLTELERSRRQRSTVDLDTLPDDAPAAPAAPPEAGLDLDSAVDRLPEKARLVLVLRHFAGCSHEEIARLLGIHVGTSKSQLHRARTLLRQALEPELNHE